MDNKLNSGVCVCVCVTRENISVTFKEKTFLTLNSNCRYIFLNLDGVIVDKSHCGKIIRRGGRDFLKYSFKKNTETIDEPSFTQRGSNAAVEGRIKRVPETNATSARLNELCAYKRCKCNRLCLSRIVSLELHF